MAELVYKLSPGGVQLAFWEHPTSEERNIIIGDEVWLAGTEQVEVYEVLEIKQPGEKYYPIGGYVCKDPMGNKRSFYYDMVIKHPRQIKFENDSKKRQEFEDKKKVKLEKEKQKIEKAIKDSNRKKSKKS